MWVKGIRKWRTGLKKKKKKKKRQKKKRKKKNVKN